MEEEGDRRRWGSQPPHKHQPDTSDANTSLWLFFPLLCGPRTTQDQRKRPGVHYPFLGNILSSLNLNHTSHRQDGKWLLRDQPFAIAIPLTGDSSDAL